MDPYLSANPAYELRDTLRSFRTSKQASPSGAWAHVAEQIGTEESPRMLSLYAASLVLRVQDEIDQIDIDLDAQLLTKSISNIFGPDNSGFRSTGFNAESAVPAWVLGTLTSYGNILTGRTGYSSGFSQSIKAALDDLDAQSFPDEVAASIRRDLESILKSMHDVGGEGAMVQAAKSLALTTLMETARDPKMGVRVRQWLGTHLVGFTLAVAAAGIGGTASDGLSAALNIATGQEAVQISVTQVYELSPRLIELPDSPNLRGETTSSDAVVDAEILEE